MSAPITPPNNSHFDANQVASIMGVIGTLGTADIKGTALPLPVGVDPLTGALYVSTVNGNAGTVNIGTVVGNVASNAADSGNPIKTGGVYNSSNITGTNGQRLDTQMSVNGFTRIDEATLIAGEDLTNNVLKTEERFSNGTFTGTATVTIKSGAGFWHGINFNNLLFGTPGSVTVWDNTAASGVQLDAFVIPIGTYPPVSILKDVTFATGLTISVSGTTLPTGAVTYR